MYSEHGSSSSHSYNDRYKSTGRSNDRDRSYSRRSDDDDRDKRRESNGRRNEDRNGDRGKDYKRRSRSPVRYSRRDEDKPSPKKANNNWSDSSSDEEDRRKVTKSDRFRRGNDQGYEQILSSTETEKKSNNGEFNTGNTGLGLDLGYQREQLPNVLLRPPPPVVGVRYPEFLNERSQNPVGQNNNNNNDNSWKLDFHHGQSKEAILLPLPPIKNTPNTAAGIQIKLLPSVTKPSPNAAPVLKPKSVKVASVFSLDDDDDEEEMPPECKMRMKNIGRETPTSAGPNSFGKTKMGFCNVNTIKERKLEEELLKKK